LENNLKKISIVLLTICWAQTSFALITFQTTLSGGYYRDIDQGAHTTLFYNLKLNQLSENGVETYIDLGINNNFVSDEWGTYPYQVYVSVPLSEGFDDDPAYVSRVQIGIIFLTEFFYADIFDGVFSNYYISKRSWITLYGGGLHIPEDGELKFDDKAYGAIYTHKISNVIVKGGALSEGGVTDERMLGFGSLYVPTELPLSPALFAKMTWDFDENSYDQNLVELDLSASDIEMLLSTSSRRPSTLVLMSRDSIYRIFSVSKQKSYGGTLIFHRFGDLEMSARQVEYSSLFREEKGEQYEVSSAHYLGTRITLKPSVLYTSSYGGTVTDVGLYITYKYTDQVDFNIDGNVAMIDKINGIEGKAYHGRGGVDYRMSKSWKSLFALEVERNYRFELDTRAVLYLSHYYY